MTTTTNTASRGGWFSLTSSALTAVVVGFASTILVIMEAARAVGATPSQQASWAAALCFGMAVTTLILSWRYKMPMITAWSTPGAVLIATSATGVTYANALGAFVVAGVLMLVAGLIKPLEKAIEKIPAPLAAAMLAGVLLRYTLGVPGAAMAMPLFVLPLIVVFFVLRAIRPLFAVPVIVVLGVAMAGFSGSFAGNCCDMVAAGLDAQALFVKDATATVQGLTFADGFGSQGGAVHVENSNVVLSTCSLVDSLADDGGGIWIDSASTATLSDVRIEGNVAADQGGGLWVGGSLVMDGGGVLGNDGKFGGGAFVLGTWEATDTVVNSNSSTTAAVHLAVGGLFDATACDFAPSTSPLDNTPNDIYGAKSAATVALGDDATRLCNDTNCL